MDLGSGDAKSGEKGLKFLKVSGDDDMDRFKITVKDASCGIPCSSLILLLMLPLLPLPFLLYLLPLPLFPSILPSSFLVAGCVKMKVLLNRDSGNLTPGTCFEYYVEGACVLTFKLSQSRAADSAKMGTESCFKLLGKSESDLEGTSDYFDHSFSCMLLLTCFLLSFLLPSFFYVTFF